MKHLPLHPGCVAHPTDPWLAARREKDRWFRTSPHSPLPDDARGAFQGLRYFDPDPAYVVEARWEPAPDPARVRVGTSTGEERDYLAAGRLVFTLEGREVALTGYLSGHGHELFVPFRDDTSGKESYGAARYLEVPLPRDGHAVIDFNEAYNPYCAYNEAYSCPLPPRENWLPVAIRAGEKAYHEGNEG